MFCAPALIYIVFCLTQIVIDLYQQMYNTAFIKTIIMIIVTILLELLCVNELTFVSWIIVMVPFIFMGVSVSILLYVFGLNVAHGASSHPSEPPPKPYPPIPYPNPSNPPPPPPHTNNIPPNCQIIRTQNFKVVNGNIVYLPGMIEEEVCS